MALDTRDKLIALMAAGKSVSIYKASIANQAAGYITALWRAAGTYEWGQGAIPGSAATCTDTLAGGINLPWSTDYCHIARFAPIGATINTWRLYDRLAHMGGLSGATTGDQTVGVSLATASDEERCAANGQDVEWYAEMYTDIGTSAQTCTVTYTDQGDNSRTLTFSLGGTSPLNRASRCIPLIPGANYTIKSVTKVNIGTSTGAAGSWGITARKPLCSVAQNVANIMGVGVDGLSIGLPLIKPTSCIELVCICSTTSTGVVYGDLLIGNIG